jgi:putative flippase GtrA
LYFNKLKLKSFVLYKFLKINNQQILRFIVSGAIASSLNFICYRSLYLIFENIFFASVSGYFIGILVSFIFAKSWVFNNSNSQPLVKSLSLFCLIYFLGGIEMSLVILIINQLIDNYKIAWVFGALIGSINNYLGSKYLSFRN